MWHPMHHQYFYFYDIINYQCKYKYVSNIVALCYLFLDTIQIKLQFLIQDTFHIFNENIYIYTNST